MTEILCMCFIKYCEAHGILNACCNLSTIEYIRSRTPEGALEYINEVMRQRGDKEWLMPKPEDKRIQFVGA